MPPDADGDEDMVLFAVPKKGRLKDFTLQLLKAVGLSANRPQRLDVAVCKDYPIKLVFLPSVDIATYVLDGHVDVGIAGSDSYEETVAGNRNPVVARKLLKPLENLGCAKCKVCLLAPAESKAKSAKDFVGKRIATTFPGLTRQLFEKLERAEGSRVGATSVRTISGSVEAACMLGIADAIVIPVDTGLTHQAAGLEIVCEVISSEGMLFRRLPGELGSGEEPETPQGRPVSEEKEQLIEMIFKRIQGYNSAMQHTTVTYNCHGDNVEKCVAFTPGRKSPAITALGGGRSGWSAISTTVRKDEIHVIMDGLKGLGAEDIISFDMTAARC